ncbi:putative P450 monooxygenase [Aspergillus heteromorphus CBS 117.55]|uniref:Putative P450 monooxygenase n=1 Tax=Aspergillus heteromorphus CBS 117.55 TaxID=1448321 RepID=A0A317W8F5_9EURO|nr:putative P450 monooxygenase [Aspergillus heteromorphus CBS 117.55]PWY82001.1 putative P450 monooxygenase [Aspergillus heteromorphus CBS 117.55]
MSSISISEMGTRALALCTIRNAPLSVVGFVALRFLYQIIHYRFFHPLRRYPGPFWASVTRLWQAWHLFWGSDLEVHWKAVQKYGPVVRVSPTMLLVADSTLLPTVYHRRDTKSRFYLSDYWESKGSVMIRDPAQHAAHRRLVGATYSMSNIQRMESLLDKHILRWFDKIDRTYVQQQMPVDFAEWTTFLSYDTLTDVGFRNPQGFIEAGSDVGGMIKAFRLGTLAFTTAGRLYPFFGWLPHTWLRRFLVVRPGQKLGFGVVMERAKKILDERTQALAEGRAIKPEKGDGSYDFLQAFMDTRTPEGEPLSSENIQTEIFVLLGAGVDGFTAMCSALLAEVLSRPPIFTRLMEEIKGAVVAGELSQPVPTYAEVARSLPFFVACVRETLRVHPVGSTALPRVVTADGPELFLAGSRVPPGTEVGASPWICHRDRAIYGADAEVFNPDRWLGDPAQVRLYEKHNFAWGYGSRVCLGKHFATMLLYKAPIALFLTFEAALCPETLETPKPQVGCSGPSLRWRDVWVNLRKRKPWVAQEGTETRVDGKTAGKGA